jgi:CRISPR/Cas system-associated exonuclease Cas4 (RecB family)
MSFLAERMSTSPYLKRASTWAVSVSVVPERCVEEKSEYLRLSRSRRTVKYATDQSSIQALKNVLEQVDLLISTTDPVPENRTPRCRELLRAASALVDDCCTIRNEQRRDFP